jgi:hypothetical protein
MMKRFWMAILLACATPALVHAESSATSGKKASKAKFDPATVVTVAGTVLGEQRVDTGKGPKAVRLVIKVGEEQVSVQLGPDSYVDVQKTRFAVGDTVSVKGSKFTYNNKYGLIAQAVTRGTETVVFRDPKGKPAWKVATAGKPGAASDQS